MKDDMAEEFNPYQEGYRAAWRRASALQANPYQMGSVEDREWERGYRDGLAAKRRDINNYENKE